VKSIQQKLKQLEGLIDTNDVTDWENEFLKSVVSRFNWTEKQLEIIERIYSKHFA
jgi:hypothetical protein